MADWTIVRVTQARQVAELMGVDEAELPDEALAAQAQFEALKAAGNVVGALDFLGHALPRLEVIAWAAHILDQESRSRVLPMRDRQALDRALRWLGDPSDGARRSTYEAAERAGSRSAERLLGLAVFLSGGSVSLPDLPAVLPPPHGAARCAVGAVKAAAYRTEQPQPILARALMLAEAVAERGIAALADA